MLLITEDDFLEVLRMADFIDILVSRFTFLSTVEKLLLRDVAGDDTALRGLSIGDISSITGRLHRLRGWNIEKACEEAEKVYSVLAERRVKCVFFGEAGYPPQLAEIYDPPFLLYYRGELPSWEKAMAAVAGTRLASGSGLDAAFELGYDLGRNGVDIVSGLAAGIDCAAHSGNTAGGGRSIGVLGCGADRIYPASAGRVASAMLQSGGAVISEYPPGTEPRKHHFPQRNRIISGLARSLVIVEAPGRSGALITAGFAVEQNRDLFIHAAAVKRRGANERIERLLFDDAPLIRSAADLLVSWGYKCEDIFLPRDLVEPDSASGAALISALRTGEELKDGMINFNGKYFRRACDESSYAINS